MQGVLDMKQEEMNAPLILDVGYASVTDLFFTGQMLRQLAMQSSIPIAINLDHGGAAAEIIQAIHAGFTSVMIDRSYLSFEENVAQVKELADIAHAAGLSVEAELGHVGQAAQYDVDRDAALTSAEDALKFIELTGVDCLAVAIGTAHGAYPEGFKPYLDFDRLVEIKKATNQFPLVLHGSSGTSNEQIEKACKLGINKVNIANDLCKAASIAVQSADLQGQNAYGVYDVLKEGAKAKLREMIQVYGSKDKAWLPVCKGIAKKETTMIE